MTAVPAGRPSLILVCGLPGAGKTTTAIQLAAERDGVRLSPDDWIEALALDLWDTELRTRIEQLQWTFGRDLLDHGTTVVVEWGTWGRSERITMGDQARAVGARVELIMLDPPLDVLWQRVRERRRENPPITRADLELWDRVIERPEPDELAGYDLAEVRTD